MKSYYSLIRGYNNSLSRENIVIGLIMISETKVFYEFSEPKVNLISKLAPIDDKLLLYGIKNFSNYIEQISQDNFFIAEDIQALQKYIKKLSVYNNGLLQFDDPIGLDLEINKAFFDNFFKKFVGGLVASQRVMMHDEVFVQRVQNDFYKKVQDKIDIDITLTRDYIPSLFFKYKLNGLGMNGSIYSVKCIDINSSRSIDVVRKEITELESLITRLDTFSKEIVEAPESNKHFLIMDNYKGTNDSFTELYESISYQYEGEISFEVLSSKDINKAVNSIYDANAKKFSKIFV